MPEDTNNIGSTALILSNLADLKADVKGIEVKLDSYSRQSERHDAQLEMLSAQVTQFVPMNVLDERRAAYDKRLVEVELTVKDIARRQDDNRDKNVTRSISVLAIVVAAIVGWGTINHDKATTTTSTTQTVQTSKGVH